MASRNDVISCAVTVTDPSGESATSSNTIMLQNRAPDAPSVSISPNPAYVGNALVCTINTTSDPDDDTTTEYYTWLINGSPQSENSNTLSTGFGIADTVECQVTSNDGLLAGSAGSDSITISNEPPFLTSVSLAPSNPTTSDSITASIAYTDPEGMPVTEVYEW